MSRYGHWNEPFPQSSTSLFHRLTLWGTDLHWETFVENSCQMLCHGMGKWSVTYTAVLHYSWFVWCDNYRHMYIQQHIYNCPCSHLSLMIAYNAGDSYKFTSSALIPASSHGLINDMYWLHKLLQTQLIAIYTVYQFLYIWRMSKKTLNILWSMTCNVSDIAHVVCSDIVHVHCNIVAWYSDSVYTSLSIKRLKPYRNNRIVIIWYALCMCTSHAWSYLKCARWWPPYLFTSLALWVYVWPCLESFLTTSKTQR